MTQARHRATPHAVAASPDGPGLHGKGPGGMWWVAWRQHRMQIAVILALVAVVTAAMIVFRAMAVARFAAYGCDLTANHCTAPNGGEAWWWNGGFSMWSGFFHGMMLLGPIVIGVFAAAPIFTREFSRGTHVFALTQSVGRLRWWVAKVTVMVVPLMVGLLVVGFVMQWVDNTVGYTANGGLYFDNFAVRSIIPAVHGLVAFTIAIAAGIVTRSTVAALASGLIVGGIALAGLAVIQPHVLSATRHVTSFDTQMLDTDTVSQLDTDPNATAIENGYLNANGETMPRNTLDQCYRRASQAGNDAVGVTGNNLGGADPNDPVAVMPPQEQGSDPNDDAYNRALIDCAGGKGIVSQYTDYLPGSMLWPLRAAMTGIGVLIAAIFLTIGAWRLRWAVAKR